MVLVAVGESRDNAVGYQEVIYRCQDGCDLDRRDDAPDWRTSPPTREDLRDLQAECEADEHKYGSD